MNGTFSPTRLASGPATATATFGRVTFTRASTADANVTAARVRSSPSSPGLTVTLIRFSTPGSSVPSDHASRSPDVSADGSLPTSAARAGSSSSTRTLITGEVPTLRTTNS